MARDVTRGTPSRTARYLQPGGPYARVVKALALGLVAAGVLVAFHLSGLREPLMPGPVISQHATIESCQECHAPGQGVSDLRCQRCHDPSGAGRLTQAAHASQVPRAGRGFEADPTAGLSCARCHVEHRGQKAALSEVDEAHCLSCHAARRPGLAAARFRISSFSAHPEFAVRRDRPPPSPGLQFTHDRHVKEVRRKLARARGGATDEMTCGECHQVDMRTRDLAPIAAETHCFSCHAHRVDLRMDPVPASEVDWPDISGAFAREEEKIAKTNVRHKDEWILRNLRRLRRELFPEAHVAEWAHLVARGNELRRRLALSEPLAGLELPALEERRKSVEAELQRLEARPVAPTAPGTPGGPTRREEVFSAAEAAGDQELVREAARRRAEAIGGGPGLHSALTAADFEARRRELLSLLEAVTAADPALGSRAERLRLRLLAVNPAQPDSEGLERARRQGLRELERIEDEIRLRRGGRPKALLPEEERRAIQSALAETEAQIQSLEEVPAPAAPPSGEERQRKEATLRALTGEGAGERCARCHVLEQGSLMPVAAARPVLVLSNFVHAPHLRVSLPSQRSWRRGDSASSGGEAGAEGRTNCAYCHGAVEKSRSSADLHLEGVRTCQACHRPGGVRQDCQSCHHYHPPVL